MISMFFLNIYIRILSLDSHLQSEIHIRSLDHIFFYIISAGSLLSIYLYLSIYIYIYIYMCVCVCFAAVSMMMAGVGRLKSICEGTCCVGGAIQ